MTYTVVVLREADGRFSAIVPALPGCATCGHTLPETLRLVEEAAMLYLEALRDFGDPIPEDQEAFMVEMGDAMEASIFKVTVGEKEAAEVA